MSLERLLLQGKLAKQETSRDEVRALFGVIERLLVDAEIEIMSTDGRFVSAYGAP